MSFILSGRTRDSFSGASSPLPGASTTSVQVAVRIRPVTSADQGSIPTRWQRSVIHASLNNSVQVDSGAAPPLASGAATSSSLPASREKRQAFSYDRVLAPTDGQSQVYSVAEPLIGRFLEGYNVTILAYGQTSSGKSYTMGTAAGDDVDYEGLVAGQTVDPNMGIIPRAVAQIFSSIKQNQARSGAVQYSAKASFIEIYNEDLIDLLADAEGDARPHVQIREGKNGQIIWSGLREVKVNNVAEVMNHLLQGSSVRRTNETDMNAQSSRSHAIFSLTLTQRKYVGSGPPPGPAHAPWAYGGRSTPGSGGRVSSGLPRPASGMPAFASRPHTPSQSGIPGLSGRHSSAGLRPGSTIGGMRSASPMFGGGDDSTGKASTDGEWVTVTSKFHFVDLAGSERLKRTAAQGDRVKEGISINSGLHALGNVISALGDPNKAKRSTHVPYRDSKLTRLLQDSLGGNAHTLMIVCVSPTEYNVSETINTLQYANRARNIKNKAELNEVEVGWDDLDYLQTLVQKLRKELTIIKSSGKVSPDVADGGRGEVGNARAAQREILEWQDRYATLSQKHSQLTADVAKLRAQLDPRKHDEKDKDDYFKLAEPIIVEYEKSIDALEGQLNLTKAALAFVEDLANEREILIDDQAAKLQVVEREIETKEATVSELQTKLSKLQERETSADTYTRELEGRLEALSVRENSDAAVVADLRKEVSRLKESERSTEQYIKDLEAKLSAAETSTTGLTGKVSQLEEEVERRDDDYKNLLARFEQLDSGNETKAMAEELEARDKRVQELEQRLRSVSSEKEAAVTQHSSLSDAMAGHQKEKSELSDKIKALEAAAAASALAGAGVGAFAKHTLGNVHENGDERVFESTDEKAAAANADAAAEQKALKQQLEELKAKMQALRDSESSLRSNLESTNVKYRESLREINDLNTQLTEAKLTGTISTSESSFHLDGGEEELEVLAPPSGENEQPRTPLRSVNSSQRLRRPESLLIDTTNRQSPANNRLLRRSSGSFLGYNKSDGTRTPGSSPHARTRSMSQSLSQELLLGFSSSLSPSHSQTRGPRPLSLSGSVPPSPTLRAFEPDSPANLERKVASLEKETMRLQEALKERDDEIQALEGSVRELRGGKPPPTMALNGVPDKPVSMSSPLRHSASQDMEENGLLTPDCSTMMEEDAGALTPATAKEFFAIKQLLAEAKVTDENGREPSDKSITRLDDLMRSMARKETQHREKTEMMNEELSNVRKQNETLQALSRDQLQNMSSEIESLRAQLAERHSTKDAVAEPLASRDLPVADTADLENKDNAAHAETSVPFQQEPAALQSAHATVLSTRDADHAAALSSKDAEMQSTLTQLKQGHAKALEKLTADHAAALESTRMTSTRANDDLRMEMEAQHLTALTEAVREAEAKATRELAAAIEALQADHSSKVDELKKAHTIAIEAVNAKHLAAISAHANELDGLTREHVGSSNATATISQLQSQHDEVQKQLVEHHTKLQALDAEHRSELEKVVEELQIVLREKDDVKSAYDQLEEKHRQMMQKAEIDPHEVDTLHSELAETSDALVTLEAALTEAQEERDQLLIEMEMIRQSSGDAGDGDKTLGGGGDAMVIRELESHKAMLSKTKSEMAKVKGDLHAMMEERSKQEQTIKDLQAKLASSETRSIRSNDSGSFGQMSTTETEAATAATMAMLNGSRSPPLTKRTSDYDPPLVDLRSHRPSLGGAGKPPPPTPPPNMPPPPTPIGNGIRSSVGIRSSISSQMTRPESPSNNGGITRTSSITSMNSDGKLSRLLAEQSSEITTLSKQLAHCEADLQANIDLVATLEAALNDSERNLRKSRVQLAEVTRERDRYSAQADEMRAQLNSAQHEVESVRNSVMLDKQNYESKIEEERQAKERARQALEARLEEVSRRKNSKLFCL